jgi:predicted phosphodiesterase
MAKIALVNDTHFGCRNDNPNYHEYMYKFWEGQFFPYLEEHNIKHIIHLGDVLDRRKYVNFKTLQDFNEKIVRQFEKYDTHIIVGNHDTYYKNTNQTNAPKELLSQFSVYSEPQKIQIDGHDILVVPWITPDNYDKTKMMLEQETADIVMGHLEVKGFEMHAGHMSDTGVEKDLFKRFETVLSGHFHKKSDDGHIYYLGCQYEFVWSDYKCPKHFHIYDTETRELTAIRNPLTIHHKIYYNDEEKEYSNFDFTQCDNKYIKLIVEKKTDYFMFDKFVDDIYKKSKLYDLKIIEDYSDLDASSVSDDIVEKTEDTPTLLDTYIDQTDTTLDKGRLKTLMKSLYTEAFDYE